MYQLPFGLARRPFSSTPDPNCIVPVGGMPEALSELEHCAQDGQGIGILTAPAGLGKTILCRKLAESLRNQFAVVFLPNANFPTRRSLLQAVLYEMGHPYLRLGEQELRLEFNAAIGDLWPDRAGLVLIVDEAHLLHNRLLEELRTALHLLHDGEMLVRLILSGQLELEERLVKKDLAAINQRIVCHVSLSSLSMVESEEYLHERIEWAGGCLLRIFEHAAVRMICQASDGNPRCLNQLADHSLLLAASENAARVTTDHVLEALEQLKQLPLHWNQVTIPQSASSKSSQVVEIVRPQGETEEANEPQAACFEWGADDEEAAIDHAPPTPAKANLAESLAEEISDEGEIEICWDEEDEDILLETSDLVVMDSGDALGQSCEEVILVKSPHATPTTWDQDLWATTEDVGFVEVRVIDPYAILDRGLVPKSVARPKRDWDSWDPIEELRAEEDAYAVPLPGSQWPDFTIIHALPKPGEEWQPEDFASRRTPITRDPSELIDRVMPLIEAALSDDCPDILLGLSGLADGLDDGPLEESSATGKAGTPEEWDSPPVMVETHLPWQPAMGAASAYYLSSRLGADLELQIAQTVLDTHTDVLPLMWSSTTESADEPKPEPPPRVANEEPIRDPGDQAPFEQLKQSLQKAVEAISQSGADEIAKAKPENAALIHHPVPVEYDIVMPEPDEEPSHPGSISRTDRPAAGHIEHHAPRRTYGDLFSKIRQKKQS